MHSIYIKKKHSKEIFPSENLMFETVFFKV